MRPIFFTLLLLGAMASRAASKVGFALIDPKQSGVLFTNFLADASAEKNRILENGSGVALGDIDGDGRCDLYFCALERPNALFRNLGNWQFEAVANAGGAACAGQNSTGAVFADVDGDGDLDLLVNGLRAGTRLFLNDGRGHFTEDVGAGLDRNSAATSMALADIDGDGDLDLFVATYRSETIQDGPTPGFEVRMDGGRLIAKPESQFEVREGPGGPRLWEKGEPDFLYLNNGSGKFSAVSWTEGRFLDEDGKPLREAPAHWGLAVMFHDLNGDGAPDLYICNDFAQSPDDIFINNGQGHFRRIAKLAVRHTSWSSMAVDVADINRDGHMDFFVADMLSPSNVRRQTQRANAELAGLRMPLAQIDYRPQHFQNTLQLNRGDGTFAEISQLAGLQATDWTWSAVFLDVDLDGWEDLLLTTGNNHDVQDADVASRFTFLMNTPPHLRPKTLLHFPALRTPKRAFKNNRDLTFVETSAVWGFDQVGISHGMALGDLDGDGDLDLVVNNLNEGAGVYRNECSAPRTTVRLKGRGVGALIEVTGGPVAQTQEMIAGGRYLSGDQMLRTFAAGTNVTVRWRSGAVSKTATMGGLVEIIEPAGPADRPAQAVAVAPWFEDVSARLGHVHHETPFEDWARQPLLPERLGAVGPRVTWVDLNNDTWPDLVIGADAFLNDRQGGFTPFQLRLTISTNAEIDGLAIVRTGVSPLVALAVSNYDTANATNAAVVFSDGAELPGQLATVGPLASGDIDGDGQPELFVGARFMPGRYPQAGASRLFRFDGARWKLDRKLSEAVADAGLVTGAQLADLDGDGDLDLALSCDWGSPKIYLNEKGAFKEASGAWGFAKYTGRWNSILAADFNGDGRLDLLVGNWGRNTKFQRYLAKPLQLAFGEFAGDKRVGMLESFFDPEVNKYVPWRGRIGVLRNIPSANARYPTFLEFAHAGTEEILEGLPHTTLEAATFDTMLFLNRTNSFEPAPLPIEAQFAPVFAMTAADFDGDGMLDVFLAQNFFGVHEEATRFDAGRGLLLKGDGRGGFRALSASESGLAIYGEQRGCAAADFDHDGRIDLVVTQNNGPTRLFRNQTGSQGRRP